MSNTLVKVGSFTYGLYKDDNLVSDNPDYVLTYLVDFIANNIPCTVINYSLDVISTKKYYDKFREDLPHSLSELKLFAKLV